MSGPSSNLNNKKKYYISSKSTLVRSNKGNNASDEGTSTENKNAQISEPNASTVKRIWKEIEEDIKARKIDIEHDESINIHKLQPLTKAIRIFVSSTFTDFFNEREILVKQVFPELKEWCNLRGLDVIECDLRWGVPSDSTNDETILTCMNEIDRCFEENGLPFFIGLLSERYGWIPNIENLNQEIIEKYAWLPGVSITFMEFLHGAIRPRNPNACFFIRSSDSLKDIPSKFKDKFIDNDDISKTHLKVLKNKLKDHFPNQCFNYSCKFDRLDNSTGREKVKLIGLEGFAKTALEFFKQAIEKFYPNLKPFKVLDEIPTRNEDLENSFQENYIDERLKLFIPRVEETNKIINFINGESCEGIVQHLDTTNENIEPIANRYLLLEGQEGSGKSTLLAYIVRYLAIQNTYKIFYHFFDASVLSKSPSEMSIRLVKYLTNELNCPEMSNTFVNPSSLPRDRLEILMELISKSKELNKKYIIIIDGIDKSPIKFYKDALYFFPRRLPPNFTCIATCDSSLKSFKDHFLNEVKEDSWYTTILTPFDHDKSKSFITKYLAKYNKKLDNNQYLVLLSKSGSNLPLWLYFACYELRIFGDHSQLNNKIQHLPDNVNHLFEYILNRLNQEFEGGLIKDIMCLIELSEVGLPENELTRLFGDFKNNEELSRLTWSKLSIQLKPFLKYSMFLNTQLVSFEHKFLKTAIDEVFLKDDDNLIRSYHRRLCDYFQYYSKNTDNATRRVAYHVKLIGDNARHIDFLKSNDARQYLQFHEISFELNNHRCKYSIGKDQSSQIFMCGSCAIRVGPLSFRGPNKDACYICGGHVFNNSQFAYTCLRHHEISAAPPNYIKCIICNVLVPKNGVLKPINACLCSICSIHPFCCILIKN